jgi:uncharacterized membrane protein (UPF0182 family)
VYFGPAISSPPADYAVFGRNGVDREYDYETNTETKNYTYTGSGGVPLGSWISRSVFAAKFAERNFLFSNVIGSNSKILFNRDPAQRVEAVALDHWRDGRWVEFATATSIGNCRLVRVSPITTTKVRLRITQAPVCPAISELALFAEPTP